MNTLGLAVMLENLGLSQYGGLDFNSLCQFGDKVLAASEQGIFELGGDTDDGLKIQAQVETRHLDFGAQARLRSVHVGYEAAGNMLLGVVDDEGDERTYPLSRTQRRHVQQSGKVVVGRDGHGRYWRLKLTNVDGVDFSIDHVEAIPVVLSRTPRRY